MALLAHLQPRDPILAARVVSTLAAVAGGVTVLFAAITPTQQHATAFSIAITIATALGVVALAGLLRRMRNRGRWMWALFPFVATGAIAALDVLTRDSSVSAQIFFLFPALYAAFQLRRTGAAMVGACTIAGDLLVVFTLLPARVAVVQCGYLAAAIVATMALLVHSGDRQDALVAELQQLLAIDSLTGLVTRRGFVDAAAAALCRAAGEPGTGLVLIDVDQFKTVNDRFGHPAGDDVLIQLAGRLKRATRATDTVSRIGGDEIAVLLPGCSMQSVTDRAEAIVRDVRAHPFVLATGEELFVSVSVGIAHLPTHGSDLGALYAAADASLYAAKRGGRDRVGPSPDELQAA